MTLPNVIESPAPTSTLATAPSGTVSATAMPRCPANMMLAPSDMSAREPNRSRSTPTGTCRPAYTTSWRTTNVDSTAAGAPNRAAASTPATPNVVRPNTATA